MSYRTKRSLYTISKFIIRLCLVGLAVYIVASVLFYFIGHNEFSALQEKIFSYKLTYLVPFLLLFGLAGTYLFKVGDDEDEPQRIRQRRRTSFSPLLASLLGIIVILFAIYKFGFKKNESYVAASKASGVAAAPRAAQQNDKAQNAVIAAQTTPAAITEEEPQLVKQEVQKDSAIIPPSKSIADHSANPARTFSNDKVDYTSVEVRYKVMSKAYLYNAPDKDTRRSAFINYNNSYSTLIPKGEKNGFVYVVFSNDKGQTTMGWLNKKDLRPVNEVVYNDSK